MKAIAVVPGRPNSVHLAELRIPPLEVEAAYPGWLARLLTHPVQGLEKWADLFEKLNTPKGAIKVYCEVAAL
jgi:hypothetical protein